MATANNTIKTRIRLKSDTEANWNKAGPRDGSNGFVPLAGELIVYSADAAHPFSRLKVGDGSTNVTALPFIDSGTLNGNETEIVTKASFDEFPSPGSEDKLYIDTTSNKIYRYTPASGYKQLSNFDLNVDDERYGVIFDWKAGTMTTAKIENNTLTIDNGLKSELDWDYRTVVTSVTKEE